MRKNEEMANPDSCLHKARHGELIFVLLGRDVAAPYAIRQWVERRIELGKNERNDPQIIEAISCAQTMEDELYANSQAERL